MLEHQFDSQVLGHFDQSFNLGFWRYSDDPRAQESLELINYLTDLDLELSEVDNSDVKYLFFKNFGEKKLFIIFKDSKDINMEQVKSLTPGTELTAIGINTKRDEENLTNSLHLKRIISIEC